MDVAKRRDPLRRRSFQYYPCGLPSLLFMFFSCPGHCFYLIICPTYLSLHRFPPWQEKNPGKSGIFFRFQISREKGLFRRLLPLWLLQQRLNPHLQRRVHEVGEHIRQAGTTLGI